jgi:hypothetical protein
MEAKKRNALCLKIGLAATALFLIIAIVIAAQSPNPRNIPFLLRVLNQQKYPASQLFLLMTLGPMIALVPFADSVKGKLADIIKVFGKVPMFYYLLHIPLIHLLAILVNMIISGVAHQEWYNTAPYVSVKPDDKWSLGLLYLVFFISVAILYFACKWYVEYKQNNRDKKWTSYI